jgi:hypothetical protein
MIAILAATLKQQIDTKRCKILSEIFFNILIKEISVVFDANSTWEKGKKRSGEKGTLINLLKNTR